jgi:uncharacterized membrane protein YfcA
MITDPWFYAAAVPALLMTGFSKSGFVSGAGMLGVPILSLVISPVQAVGIMLPLLLVSDLVGVANYWRTKHPLNFKILFVASLIGSGLGWATAAMIPEDWVRIMVGALGTLFSLDYWLKLRPMPVTPPLPSWPRGLFWGGLAAYASFITQAAGPPLAVYLMPQRLAPAIYAATAISILTCMNLMKVVPYYLMGQLNVANLTTSLVLVPLAVACVYLGLWLVRRIPSEPFYKISYGALLVVSVKLVWDGVRALA